MSASWLHFGTYFVLPGQICKPNSVIAVVPKISHDQIRSMVLTMDRDRDLDLCRPCRVAGPAREGSLVVPGSGIEVVPLARAHGDVVQEPLVGRVRVGRVGWPAENGERLAGREKAEDAVQTHRIDGN